MSVAEIVEIGNARQAARRLPADAGQATGADITAVALDLALGNEEKARRQVTYGSATLFRVVGEMRAAEEIFYPTILSRVGDVALGVDELLDEIEVVAEMRDRSDDLSPLVYSIAVTDPTRWNWPTTGPTLVLLEANEGRRAELETGYVYHEFLYRLHSSDRVSLLRQLLADAQEVQISVRCGGSEPVKTTVKLRQKP